MIMLNYMITLIIILCIIMILIVNILSMKTFFDREKSSPFECGFDPKSFARMPFSLQFFLIAVIFLIFDIEITLLFPMILTLKFTQMASFASLMVFFITILLLGLLHEWKQNSLEWSS